MFAYLIIRPPRQPIVTGTSVLGIKFKDGIMMAADTLGMLLLTIFVLLFSYFCVIASYGSLARFKDVSRLFAVGKYTVIGASGDMSDFQYIQQDLEQLLREENFNQDGHDLEPINIHEYMSTLMYNRRSKMNPLWNNLVIGGVKDGDRYA